MCGIAGLFQLNHKPIPADLLTRMAEVQKHRGPDGEGFAVLSRDPSRCKFSSRAGLSAIVGPAFVGAFAHRRLAILDLTDAATQPMANDDGTIWMIYNGEVYNYLELRRQLEARGHRFRSSGDAEVVLKAYQEWGLDCFGRFNGMWGIAIWDTRKQTLILSRDRFGIKPLHYHFDGERLVFASEIKAILEAPWVPRKPDQASVADYLVHSRVNGYDRTFFENILAVPAGHYLAWKLNGKASRPVLVRWWHLQEHLQPPPENEKEAIERFRSLLTDAVRIRLRSDVPVGTALSGGLDSSSIVGLARPFLIEGDQKSFSACFDDFELDEKKYIDAVVDHTGVDNHIVRPTADRLVKDLENLIWHQEEPFGSTSIYAQYKVFELAHSQETPVTLDGQGADELLAGYDYFFPVFFAGLLFSGRLSTWQRETSAYARSHGRSSLYAWLSTGAGLLSHRQMIRLANRWDKRRDVSWISSDVRRVARNLASPGTIKSGGRLKKRLYEIFSASGLPALLRYEDRNAMAHSVESRLPFMDWRLVSYLFSLPASMKIRNGATKWILRQAMQGMVPEDVLNRRDKIGFATPESQWFRYAAKEMLADLVLEGKDAESAWWLPEKVERLWRDYQSGEKEATGALWRLANLRLWEETFL